MVRFLSSRLICLVWLVPASIFCQPSSANGQKDTTEARSVKAENIIEIIPPGESTAEGGSFYSYRKALFDLLRIHNISFDFIGSLKGAGTDWDTNHFGMSGKACKDLSDWIKNNSTSYKADIILLWEDTNDCGLGWQYYGTPKASLNTLIDDICMNQPQAELFVSTIPMMGDNAYIPPMTSGGANANVNAYNKAIHILIAVKRAQGKKVHFVDTGGDILAADLTDGIHPTQNGYDKMAPYWFKAITPFIGLNSDYGYSDQKKLGLLKIRFFNI